MLRIMFLNTWGGELWEELRWYVTTQVQKFDVICLTEVHHLPGAKDAFITPTLPGSRKSDIFACQFEALCKLLPKHVGYYTAHGEFMLHDLERHESPIKYGNAMFISRHLSHFISTGMVFGQYNRSSAGWPAPRSIQGVTFRKGNDAYAVAHFHGVWTGGPKEDTEDRYRQSINADAFVTDLALKSRSVFNIQPKVIIGGDFNLTSKTTSLRMLAKSKAFDQRGRILNHEFGVTDTRTSHYAKEVREADFALVSPSVKVFSFTAPAEPEISDHRPLILECE